MFFPFVPAMLAKGLHGTKTKGLSKQGCPRVHKKTFQKPRLSTQFRSRAEVGHVTPFSKSWSLSEVGHAYTK